MEQRLTYYRKDIVELLAERDKSEVAAEFKKRDLLHRNELLHFMQIDDRVQSYNYLFDAILVHGAIEAEKFYRYLIDADETEYFFNLVAPKGLLCSNVVPPCYVHLLSVCSTSHFRI